MSKCRFLPRKLFGQTKRRLFHSVARKIKYFPAFKNVNGNIFRFVQDLFQKKKPFSLFWKIKPYYVRFKIVSEDNALFSRQKNKQRLFWINTCFRPVKLTSVSAALWKLDICIVFFRCLHFFPFSRFVFCPKLLFLQYSTKQKPLLCLQQISIIKAPFACNNQTTNRLSLAT